MPFTPKTTFTVGRAIFAVDVEGGLWVTDGSGWTYIIALAGYAR